MAATEQEIRSLEEFFEVVDGDVAADDRYGQSTRFENSDGVVAAIRFDADEVCWLEVAVEMEPLQVCVGFVTTDADIVDELTTDTNEGGSTFQQLVAGSLADAGLDWPDVPVTRSEETGPLFRLATPLVLEDLVDLDTGAIRNKVMRMLEGYLIAVGPLLEVGDEPEEA